MDLGAITQSIVEHRKRKRMTQDELAKRAGVSRILVAKLETGRYPDIGITRLLRLLHVLGLDLRVTTLNQRRPTLDDLRSETSDGDSA